MKSGSKKNAHSRKTYIKAAIGQYLFVMPALLYMVGLVGYALVYNVLLGFQDVTAATLTKERFFIGLKNYVTLAAENKLGTVIMHTLQFTLICIVFEFIIGLLLALFFNRASAVAKAVRGGMMVSYVIPAVATALLFKFMFSSDAGVIDYILMKIGITSAPLKLLTNAKSAMWAPIIAAVWQQIPYNMLLLLTGIINIPSEIIDSSAVDGANAVQRFFYITVPMLKKTMLSVLMLGFLNTFKVFDLIYSMTGGGPLGSTEVLSTMAYNLSFSKFKFSLGAATANILFLCLLVIAVFYSILIMREE